MLGSRPEKAGHYYHNGDNCNAGQVRVLAAVIETTEGLVVYPAGLAAETTVLPDDPFHTIFCVFDNHKERQLITKKSVICFTNKLT